MGVRFRLSNRKMTELETKFNLLEHETKERYKKTIEEGSWTANKGFTVEEGEKDISQFVSKWALDECWLYCIDYIECVETESWQKSSLQCKILNSNTSKTGSIGDGLRIFCSDRVEIRISKFSNRSRVPSRGTPPEAIRPEFH